MGRSQAGEQARIVACRSRRRRAGRRLACARGRRRSRRSARRRRRGRARPAAPRSAGGRPTSPGRRARAASGPRSAGRRRRISGSALPASAGPGAIPSSRGCSSDRSSRGAARDRLARAGQAPDLHRRDHRARRQVALAQRRDDLVLAPGELQVAVDLDAVERRPRERVERLGERQRVAAARVGPVVGDEQRLARSRPGRARRQSPSGKSEGGRTTSNSIMSTPISTAAA